MRTRSLVLSLVVPALVCTSCSTTAPQYSAQKPPLPQAAAELKYARRVTLPAETRAAFYIGAAALAAPHANEPRAQAIYNAAATELTDMLRDADNGQLWNRPLTFTVNGSIYRLSYSPPADGIWAPAYFTGFRPAGKIKRRHLRREVTEPGVGGTLVGVHETPGYGVGEHAPFELSRGLAAAVTSTLNFQKSDALLTLNDPTERRTVQVGGRTFPLAANFTAPIAYYPPRSEFWEGLMGLLQVEKYLKDTGLYMIHPYDPDRIPVILVHGLASTPQMWVNVINEVEADSQLRGKFQFWFFRYPTGVPVAYSALRLREELSEMEKLHAMPQGFILVGHSMGGLLARMQTADSGRVIWDANFGKKADALYARLPPDDLVKRALIFQANPLVRREIFINVPHRGSDLAIGSIGAFAIRLISLPATLVTTITKSLGDILQTVGGKQIVPTSIISLSPKSPTLLAMDTLPIRAPYHSIIGDRGKGDTPNSSDGVVPYWSSHLDGAQSELIVPGPHGSFELPQTIDELIRILREDAKKSPRR